MPVRLTTLAQLPIELELPLEKWLVPVMTLRDFVAWGKKADETYVDTATKGMSTQERFQHLVFIGILPTNLNALRRMAKTPEGMEQVLRTCLPKAMVTHRRDNEDEDYKSLPTRVAASAEMIDNIIAFGDNEEQEALVMQLAGIKAPLPVVTTNEEGEGKQNQNPTSKPSENQKTSTPTTGPSDSASSTLATQDKIRSTARSKSS